MNGKTILHELYDTMKSMSILEFNTYLKENQDILMAIERQQIIDAVKHDRVIRDESRARRYYDRIYNKTKYLIKSV